MRVKLVSAMAVLALCASSAGAQKRAQPNRDAGQRRAVLNKQFRERGEQLVREHLNLTPDQLKHLRDINGRLDGQRGALLDRERATRIELRQELARGKAADQPRVAQLMKQTGDLQQQRFQLQQDEQRELATFLTPVQQAQYFGLQAQLRQTMRKMREQQEKQNGQSPGPPAPKP